MISKYCLNHVMNAAFVQNGGSFYIGLSSSAPTSSGTNYSEPSGNGYARVKVENFTMLSDGVVTNRDTLAFPLTTGTWFSADARAAYWCLFDGSGSNANMLASGSLNTPRTIEEGVVITVPAGALNISLVELAS